MYIFVFIHHSCLHTCYDWSMLMIMYWKLFKEGTMAYTAAEFTMASNTDVASNTALLREGACSLLVGWARVALCGNWSQKCKRQEQQSIMAILSNHVDIPSPERRHQFPLPFPASGKSRGLYSSKQKWTGGTRYCLSLPEPFFIPKFSKAEFCSTNIT